MLAFERKRTDRTQMLKSATFTLVTYEKERIMAHSKTVAHLIVGFSFSIIAFLL